MNYIWAIPIAICCGIVAYGTLNKEIADKVKMLHIMGTPAEKSKEMNQIQVVGISILVSILCYGAVAMLFIHTIEVINRLKMVISLICITGAACNDYREQRIPNIFPFTMVVSGVILLAVGYFVSQNGAVAYIVSSITATFFVIAGMAIAAVLTKKGIGIGDIKLLGAVALTGGVYTVGSTMFFGMIACFIVAVVLLLSKKKTMKESLAFGPFIFVGYIISIYTSIY